MADDYAPFPEQELEALAATCDTLAKLADVRLAFEAGSMFADRADMLRNANVCHNALRERCLLAETENNQLKRGNHAA